MLRRGHHDEKTLPTDQGMPPSMGSCPPDSYTTISPAALNALNNAAGGIA